MMATKRQQRVALITGCSSGIGRELALELARRGHRVIATARKLEAVADLKSDSIDIAQLDVNDSAAAAAVIDGIIETHERLDILVNNAGFSLIGPFAEMSRDDVRKHFETNAIAPMELAALAAKHMIRQRSGTIVNIGSVNSILAAPFTGPYSGTKAALHIMSEVLRMELWPFNIHVVAVHAGGVRTKFRDNFSADLATRQSASTHYANELRETQTMVTTIDKSWLPVEVFARKLATQVLRRRPPRVVRLGTWSRVGPVLHAVLPASLREWVFRKATKLKKQPAPQ